VLDLPRRGKNKGQPSYPNCGEVTVNVSQDDFDALAGTVDERGRERLLAYSLSLTRKYKWPDRVDARELAEDVTMDAICKALSGERKWSRAATPSPEDFLRSVVKSLVWNELQKSWNPSGTALELTEDVLASDDVVAEVENRLVNDELIMQIAEAIRDDPLASAVLDLVLGDTTSPSEIAAQLGETVEAVLAAKKRIRRAADKVASETSN